MFLSGGELDYVTDLPLMNLTEIKTEPRACKCSRPSNCKLECWCLIASGRRCRIAACGKRYVWGSIACVFLH